MGLPWLGTRSSVNVPFNTRENKTMSHSMDISSFANGNLKIVGSGVDTVLFRYKFRDFQGATPVFTGQEAVLETHCQEFEVPPDMLIPLRTGNLTDILSERSYRWIYVIPDNNGKWFIHRNATIQICKSSTDNLTCLNDIDSQILS